MPENPSKEIGLEGKLHSEARLVCSWAVRGGRLLTWVGSPWKQGWWRGMHQAGPWVRRERRWRWRQGHANLGKGCWQGHTGKAGDGEGSLTAEGSLLEAKKNGKRERELECHRDESWDAEQGQTTNGDRLTSETDKGKAKWRMVGERGKDFWI